MNPNSNKNFKYLLPAGLIFFALVIFYFIKISVPGSNSNVNLPQNWATYSSLLHKFEIQYPADWLVQKEVGHPPATIFSMRNEAGGYCSLNLLIVAENFDNSSEMDWYRQNGYREKAYTLDGMQATKFSKFPVPDSAPVAVIYFDKNTDRIDMIASADKYQDCMAIFNQMLTSFKTLK